MKRKLKSLNKLLLWPVVLFLTGCQILSSAEQIEQTVAPAEDAGPKVTFETEQSKDPQSKIGAKGHPRILAANSGAYQSQKLERLLALVTGRLVAVSNDPNRAYTVTVLDTASVNAFALPGGYLYVTRGLLALANDASEIAAVLAHEMAHVSSNHGVRRSREAQAVDIAERVATEVVSNPVVGQVAKASTEQRLAAFSKRQELQADAVGIKMLGAAGFDPFAASRFLESMDRFSAWRSDSSSGGQDMSSSHPSTPQRVELARRHARLVGPRGTGEQERKRYLQGVDGLVFGDTSKDGAVRGNRFVHAKLGFSFSVPNGFELSNRDDSVLASGPNQVAIRFDAAPKKGAITPASYLQSGWVNGLRAETVKSQRINGLQSASGRAQAGDWQFLVTVIEFKKRFYRFIMAAPRASTDIEAAGEGIPATFKKLSRAEKKSIKPLQVSVVKVKPNDTIAVLAGKQRGVSRKVSLFRALNGLAEGQRLKPGDSVKLVVD